MKNNEIVKNMEYLIKGLHKEWERSGVTRKEVTIGSDEMDGMRAAVAERICDITSYLESTDCKFRTAMDYSKESYVLLRMAKKMAEVQDEAGKNVDKKIVLPLDREEIKLFRAMFVAKKR